MSGKEADRICLIRERKADTQWCPSFNLSLDVSLIKSCCHFTHKTTHVLWATKFRWIDFSSCFCLMAPFLLWMLQLQKQLTNCLTQVVHSLYWSKNSRALKSFSLCWDQENETDREPTKRCFLLYFLAFLAISYSGWFSSLFFLAFLFLHHVHQFFVVVHEFMNWFSLFFSLVLFLFHCKSFLVPRLSAFIFADLWVVDEARFEWRWNNSIKKWWRRRQKQEYCNTSLGFQEYHRKY